MERAESPKMSTKSCWLRSVRIAEDRRDVLPVVGSSVAARRQPPALTVIEPQSEPLGHAGPTCGALTSGLGRAPLRHRHQALALHSLSDLRSLAPGSPLDVTRRLRREEDRTPEANLSPAE